MKTKRNHYHVQRNQPTLGWIWIPFAEGSRAFCDGYVFAMDSLYPSVPHRIVDSEGNVVRETKGRGEVHVN